MGAPRGAAHPASWARASLRFPVSGLPPGQAGTMHAPKSLQIQSQNKNKIYNWSKKLQKILATSFWAKFSTSVSILKMGEERELNFAYQFGAARYPP